MSRKSRIIEPNVSYEDFVEEDPLRRFDSQVSTNLNCTNVHFLTSTPANSKNLERRISRCNNSTKPGKEGEAVVSPIINAYASTSRSTFGRKLKTPKRLCVDDESDELQIRNKSPISTSSNQDSDYLIGKKGAKRSKLDLSSRKIKKSKFPKEMDDQVCTNERMASEEAENCRNGKKKKPSAPKKKKDGPARDRQINDELNKSKSKSKKKTPVSTRKKSNIKRDDEDIEDEKEEVDETVQVPASAVGRSRRSAAVKARVKVSNMDWEEEPIKKKIIGSDDDDDYVDDEDDDEDFGESKKKSQISESGKDQKKIKRWKDKEWKESLVDFKSKQEQTRLFPEWMPKKEHYREIPPSEGTKFLPVNQKVKFKIQRKAACVRNDEFVELDLFQHHTNEDSFTIKIGGPLWSMDWCPTPTGTSNNQYLAVYTHQSPAQVHSILASSATKSLIQIWNFGKLSNKMSSNQPDLLSLLLLEGGPLWQMKWAPGASSWNYKDDQDIFNSRIGLLACASHSGQVKIFSIPSFKDQKESKGCNQNNNNGVTSHPSFYEVTSSATLKTTGSAASPCICLDWNINGSFPLIAAGFADGAISLWNLSSRSKLLMGCKVGSNESDDNLVLYPYRTFKAHLSVVSGLNFCPTSDHLFVSCSHDKYFKIWNINETSQCILSHRAYKFTAITWPINEKSKFYAGFDEAYINQRNSVACYNFYEYKVAHINHCIHNSTIMSISHREQSNMIASCDNAGCLQTCLNITESVKRTYGLRKVISIMQLVDDNEPNNYTCNCESFASKKSTEEGNFPLTCCCNKNFVIKDFTKNWQFKGSLKSQTELPFDDIVKNPHSALHRVLWNPNQSSYDWIAFGGFNGLLRIRLAPDVHHDCGAPLRECDSLRTL